MNTQKTGTILNSKTIARFKAIGHQKEIANPIVVAKLIESTGSIDMYVTQYNATNNTCYGFVIIRFMELIDAEYKTIDMNILEEMKQNGDTKMFLDTDFVECHIKDCIPPHLYTETIKNKG
ncbi:MAG: hypothetical protein ACPGSD_15205 [Flavobacteriales bacterium]